MAATTDEHELKLILSICLTLYYFNCLLVSVSSKKIFKFAHNP